MVRVGEFLSPLTGTIQYHSQLGLVIQLKIVESKWILGIRQWTINQYISFNDDLQNYPFCGLKLLVEKFGLYWF